MSDLPTLHMVGLFHTVPSLAFSHCAFTGKVLRFAKMMRMQGYKVIEYANDGSESEADEHVPMLDGPEFAQMVGPYDNTQGTKAVRGSAHWNLFHARLKQAMHARVKPGDIICHPFGNAHQELVGLFPQCKHVETGIGYDNPQFGAYQVFESQTWRHFLLGKYGKPGADFEWVVPNYFDLDEWTVQEKPDTASPYLLYLGRVIASKGMAHLKALAEHQDLPVLVVGQAEPGVRDAFAHPNMIFRDPVAGIERDALVGGATAMLMPTRFIEPFGGAGVEGLLCGTPLIASAFGGMTETVQHGRNGFLIHTLGDMLEAVKRVKNLHRLQIAFEARMKYGLPSVGYQYDQIFQTLTDPAMWFAKEGRL